MTVLRRSPEDVIVPRGFLFGAAIAGVKASGRPDLGLAYAPTGASAAALFTKNRVAAAPIEVGRKCLRASQGRLRALLVNSGNANCATGQAGKQSCEHVCREAAKLMGVSANQVLPSSTGIIGVPFPAEKVVRALPDLMERRSESTDSVLAFARAILTTDTRMKVASAQFHIGEKHVNVLGVAKGSGMIHPNLATMLVYIFTDLSATPAQLRTHLRLACQDSFNSMSVDGDTSTNDTVLLLASGQSEVRHSHRSVRKKFTGALLHVCQSLAEQIVSDGEGVRHVIRLTIEQAGSRNEALMVARAIAHSALVKTAWAGADPNWGRILAAAGSCGVAISPKRVEIRIGDQRVCHNGVAYPFDRSRAHEALSQPECHVRVQLGRGKSSVQFLTTDLTAEYVRINADYST